VSPFSPVSQQAWSRSTPTFSRGGDALGSCIASVVLLIHIVFFSQCSYPSIIGRLKTVGLFILVGGIVSFFALLYLH